jgi:hypothetical protein
MNEEEVLAGLKSSRQIKPEVEVASLRKELTAGSLASSS